MVTEECVRIHDSWFKNYKQALKWIEGSLKDGNEIIRVEVDPFKGEPQIIITEIIK